MPSVNEKKYYWLLRTCSMPKMQLYVISTLFVSIFSESEQMWKGSWRELNLVIAVFCSLLLWADNMTGEKLSIAIMVSI